MKVFFSSNSFFNLIFYHFISQEDVKAVRLGNNNISELDIICGPLVTQLNASMITWLDISFNGITKISTAMADVFPNITTLYLHANNISKISEIKKLSKFQNLKSVTFYGNPVEENKHYRNMVLYSCPKLLQLDFSTITATQKDKVGKNLLLNQ